MKLNHPGSAHLEGPGLLFLRAVIFSLLALFSFQWNAFATATRNQESPSSPLNGSAPQPYPGAFTNAGAMPGTVPVFADIDGDKHQDYVTIRLSGNNYRIFVVLSSGSRVTVLNPPVQLGVFTIHVCDVNHDNLQDILVRSPATEHPVAVWLGKGNGIFEPADQSFFQTDFGFTGSTAYRSSHLQFYQDLLLDSPHPDCERVRSALAHLDPNPNGLIIVGSSFVALHNQLRCLAPRSPPYIFAI